MPLRHFRRDYDQVDRRLHALSELDPGLRRFGAGNAADDHVPDDLTPES